MNKVYGAILSPFVRKVLMALEHKGIEYELEVVMPFDRSVAFKRISPLRKIPAFQDERVTLADSSVICDYLEHRHPDPGLYPADPVERARSLWFEELADTRLQDLLGVGIFFERMLRPKMFHIACDEGKVARNIAALRPQLDYLEGQIPNDGFLVGGSLSIADLIVPGVFLNASYAGYRVDEDRWPRLAAYLRTLLRHPVYLKRIAEEQEFLKALQL